MADRKNNITVRKASPEQEQRMKDEAFLKLTPEQRLGIHEELRRRIWGKKYNHVSLKGMKVRKKKME